jgi:hypothetical protein
MEPVCCGRTDHMAFPDAPYYRGALGPWWSPLRGPSLEKMRHTGSAESWRVCLEEGRYDSQGYLSRQSRPFQKKVPPQFLTLTDPSVRLREQGLGSVDEKLRRGYRCWIARSRPPAQIDSNNRQNKNNHRSDNQHDPLHPGVVLETLRPERPRECERLHKKCCADALQLQIMWPSLVCAGRTQERVMIGQGGHRERSDNNQAKATNAPRDSRPSWRSYLA